MFDPDTDTVSRVSSSGTSSNAVAIYTAPDGRVIVPGGVMDDGTNFVPQGTISVFDPATSIVGALPQSLTSPRMHFGSALLRDGSVMVAAGVDDAYPKTYWCSGFTFPTTSAVDHIDVSTGMVTSFPALPANIMDLVAVTMGDGSILVGGGTPCGSAMAYAQLYYLESAPIL